MNPWRPYPLIRLAAAFIAGILAAILRFLTLPVSPVILVAAVVPVVFLAAFPGLFSTFRLRWLRGLFIFSALFLLGNQYTVSFGPAYFGNSGTAPAQASLMVARITEEPAPKARSIRVTADLWIMDSISRSFRHRDRALVYLARDSNAGMLSAGDLILLKGYCNALPEAGYPGGFSMRKYYSRQGVFSQIYVSGASWRRLGEGRGMVLRRLAAKFRHRLLDILRENRVEGQEFAVAAALMLGYVAEIDRETLGDYSASGAMHILSVSGMHVGVVYLFLEFFLGLIGRRSRNGGLAGGAKALLLVSAVWCYAMLTGLSPPVQRAAIMLSLVIAGRNMKRQPHILNILAASLFVILLSDPFLALDTGCQFSHLAVAGIVLMHKPVYDLYVTSNWLADKLWSLVAVSVAAQLVTFPLGLFTFHMFPNYFLLTNILAVPLSSIIIYTGIFLLAVHAVPWLGPLTGNALSILVWMMNRIVSMIEGLPGSVLRGVFISLPEMFLLYALVIFLFLFFLKKRKSWLFMFLVTLNLFAANSLFQRLTVRGNAGTAVCHGRATAIGLVSGNSHFLLLGSALDPMNRGLPERLQGFYSDQGITRHYSGYLSHDIAGSAVVRSPGFLLRSGNLFLAGDTRIAVLSRTLPKGITQPFMTDLLILTSNPQMTLQEIMKAFTPGRIVADGTNASWRVRDWEREAAGLGIRFEATEREGALLIRQECTRNER